VTALCHSSTRLQRRTRATAAIAPNSNAASPKRSTSEVNGAACATTALPAM